MHGVMSESSAILNSQPCSAEQSMSSNQAFDCCSNSTTIALSSTMPALLHNSKRKRLDAVLTKLSMSNTQKQGECKKEDIEIEPSDLTCSTPDLSELGRDKSPQKQLSVDSEMSMTVGSLKLDIGDEGSAGTTAVSECTSSTLSPTSTTASSEHRPHVKLSQSFSGPSSSVELPQHSGTEFSASSISPLSSLFTPPTSDSAGGTADLDEEDEEHVTEQSDDQVSSKNTVAKSSAKYTLVAEHFFGSPEVGKKQPSLKKSPQAKLLSHDSTEKQCENATIPDAQTRSRMLKSLLPATELVSSSSTIPCTGPLLRKLSYGCFTGDSLPNFPFCKCSHCQSLADQTSSKMPSISHLYSGHSTAHSWSWQNLKQEAVNVPVHCDSFLSLLNSSPNDTYRTQPLSAVSSEKAQRSDLGNIFSPCFLETARPKVPTVSRVTDQSKKRSRSDSDMVSEYLSLSKHLGAYLHQAEPGLILKDGRCVPKPLRSTAHSEHTTPQDSPLDLSVKSLSPHITSPKYSELLAISKRAAFASSSVPSLSSPKSHLSALRASSQSFRLTHNDHRVPHKRRNISSSDSLYSSSLSSVSSLSPLEKHLAESQVAKCLSPLFGMCQEQESVVSTVPFTSDPLVASSTLSVRVSSTQSKVDKSSTKCQEQKAHSLSSLSDLDSSIFTCQICGQTFALHDRLAKHVASRHKNRQQCDSVAKNYLCDVCQRSFARSDMLTRHMRLHTGLKPYTCKICGQVFSRSDHLSTHQRTHTGEKPYKCPQCPYAACRRDMITRHMRTHSRYETPDSSSSTEELSK